jgi:hypothetical protein
MWCRHRLPRPFVISRRSEQLFKYQKSSARSSKQLDLHVINRNEVAVIRRPSWRDVLLTWLAEYFELLLTIAGVLVAMLIVFAELDRGEQGRLLTFIVWLQGVILWSVHRHAVLGRRALIRKMRVMLQDRVNNQLTIMLGAAESRGRDGRREPERADLESALTAARSVATELENLSLDSLHRWEHRYRRLIPRLLR